MRAADDRILLVFRIVVLAFAGSPAFAGEVHPDLPSQIDPDGHYVIYSHGRIVEGDDPRPVHERWGVYDFPEIVSTLAEGRSFTLIARHRPGNAELASDVEQLESWVNQLVAAGVKPERITLVGFSRGGQITALAASGLEPMRINTALLGTCWPGGVQEQASIALSGRLLSIYEATDFALSCDKLAERSEQLLSYEEHKIATGKEHGAFYKPVPDWIDPLLLWIQKGGLGED